MKMGLCEGRHDIPGITSYIFPADFFKKHYMFDSVSINKQISACLVDMTRLELYVTGLTIALTSVIKYCLRQNISLVLYHYDKELGEYIKQFMF